MILKILKNYNFRNFFLADIISGFGSGMNFVAVNWFVLQRTGSNKMVGLMLALGLLSGLLVFPFAGTVADRFSRKSILMISNMFRGVVILMIAALFSYADFGIAYVCVLVVVNGIGWTIFIPASKGLAQEIMSKEDLMAGNSLIEISFQVGMFAAAAAAGIVYKYYGFSTILVIDAATFFVSNLFLLGIRYKLVVVHSEALTFFKQFVDGGKYLLAHPVILVYGVILFVPYVATMSMNVVKPGYVSDYLKAGPVVYGMSGMLYGIGACLSGFWASTIVTWLNRSRAIVMYFVVSACFIFLLVVTKDSFSLYISSLVVGFTNSSLRIVMTAHIMELVPKSYMGRSMAVWLAVSLAMQIVSVYGVGSMMDSGPVQYGFIWIGCIMVLGVSCIPWFMSRLRDMTCPVENLKSAQGSSELYDAVQD
jgi:MFS family permease